KGGIHVAAVAKLPESYQHIDPALVGNEMRVVVSELSGRQNVRLRAGDLGLGGGARDSDAEILRREKELEFQGHQFEAADGSFEMLVRRSATDYRPPFELLGFTVIVEGRSGGTTTAQAMVQLRVDGEVIHTAAEGAGPVNALDCAVRKALLPRYPELADVHLVDYKVRIVDGAPPRAARSPYVLTEQAEDEPLVGLLERPRLDHVAVAAGREGLRLVEHVGDAVRHPGGKVASHGPEHDHHARRHVLAAVRPGAFDHGHGAGVAHREAVSRPPGREQLAPRGAIEHGVAQQA